MISAIALSLAVSMGYANKPDSVKVEAKWKGDHVYAAIQAVPATIEGFLHGGVHYNIDLGGLRLSPYLGGGLYYEKNIRHPWRTDNHITPRPLSAWKQRCPSRAFGWAWACRQSRR